jgi:photosystem II stability/assembly factor-like uncharacterized protein
MERHRPGLPTSIRARRWPLSLSRRSLALVAVAGLALAGGVRASGLGGPRASGGPAERAVVGQLRAAQLVTASSGWALSPHGLSRTDDGGTTWTDITPAGALASGVRGAFFLDAAHGWAVASGGSASESSVPLLAFRTADGGRTWTPGSLVDASSANAAAYGGPAWVRFVDTQHGWIVVKDVSSSNFSFGRLFRTTDGGRTWTALQAPLGDPVTFLDTRTGWTAGGPTGDRLFVTRDAGRTWQRQTVRPPAGTAGDRLAYALPVQADGAVVLSVTLVRGDQAAGVRTTVAWYRSADAGRTWQLANRISATDQVGPGVRVPVAAAGADTWISVLPSSRRLVRLRDGGATLAVQSPTTAPAGVQDLQFASPTTGWALASSGTCPPGGPCGLDSGLFRTSDGGSTWHEVTVP